MSNKDLEPLKTGLVVHNIEGISFIAPEYRNDFFESNWGEVIEAFRKSIFFEKLTEGTRFQEIQSRRFMVGEVIYELDEESSNKFFCYFNPENSIFPRLSYNLRDRDFFLNGELGFTQLLLPGVLQREERYIIGDKKDGSVGYVLDVGFRNVILPRNSLELGIEGEEKFDNIGLFYCYANVDGRILPVEITVDLLNRFKKEELDEDVFEGVYAFDVNKSEKRNTLLVYSKERESKLTPKVKNLLKAMAGSVTEKELEFEEESVLYD